MHPYLSRQISKYLSKELHESEQLAKFLEAVSASYHNYDKDRELSEHAFFVNEQEYEAINRKLRLLTQELEAKVKERTTALESIARFPKENPNPIIRISQTGKILFLNQKAQDLEKIVYQKEIYTLENFFKKLAPGLENTGSFEIDCNEDNYLFYYRRSEAEGDINLFGTNITERNTLRKRAYDNFYRLSNFLESTDDAYYVVYTKYSEKNFVTSKWATFFGFNPTHTTDIFKQRIRCIRKDFLNRYKQIFTSLQLGDKVSLSYCAINKKTKEEYWLEEIVSKQFDPMSGDIIITGRISDKTKQHIYSEQVRESEERFKLLMDNLPVMVWVSDSKNVVNYSNKAAAELLGKPLHAVDGQAEFNKLIHPEDRKTAIQEWGQQLKQKNISVVEFRLRGPDGQYKNLYQKAVPRYYQDGTYAGYIGAIFDFTKEKQYQQRLSEEKEKLDLVTKNSPDVIVLANEKGIIEYISPSATRILGFSHTELTGKNFLRMIRGTAIEKKKFSEFFKKSQLKGGHLPVIQLKDSRGNNVWMESAITVIRTGKTRRILLYNRDITSEKIAQEALVQSENKYKGLFESMRLGVMEVDNNDNILWVNKSFEQISGYKTKELLGKRANQLFLTSKQDQKKMISINSRRQHKEVSMYEIPFRNKSGKKLELVISGSPIIDKDGNVRGSVGIHWDVTPMREMQRKMEADRLNREHDIMQASLNAEEQQKEVLGRELHDGVGQMLTYTSLYLQMASESSENHAKLFLTAREKILSTLNEVRRISRSLVPGVLNDLGLKEAIFELANQIREMTGIEFNFKCPGTDINGIDFTVKTSLYRIVQEMTNNTLKYAQAKKITLYLGLTPRHLSLKYSDDGVGFDEEKVKYGVGLKSIQTRIAFLGGDVTLKSAVNMGVQYNIQIPLSKVINRK